ncbi:uncharacterized protein BO72DRAFT_39058 [Aspergillus fijiensis CBS 313.89]|uniref:REJ domain-containing protein n=1 Tax=Aspergillus fijiensis CBS 313.89 TaxID=1448319 RepID=A0A8G1REZ8_9EURO|nr:uncharacterized protein BO72DRAFT_39058 [Aspergillus fijiensis CBS 313.89]RAK70943.1 hypothetical protein BO72DRAFT_39058 [Aspergillus fijiensis CBS 313.89]
MLPCTAPVDDMQAHAILYSLRNCVRRTGAESNSTNIIKAIKPSASHQQLTQTTILSQNTQISSSWISKDSPSPPASAAPR